MFNPSKCNVKTSANIGQNHRANDAFQGSRKESRVGALGNTHPEFSFCSGLHPCWLWHPLNFRLQRTIRWKPSVPLGEMLSLTCAHTRDVNILSTSVGEIHLVELGDMKSAIAEKSFPQPGKVPCPTFFQSLFQLQLFLTTLRNSIVSMQIWLIAQAGNRERQFNIISSFYALITGDTRLSIFAAYTIFKAIWILSLKRKTYENTNTQGEREKSGKNLIMIMIK